MRHNSTIHNGTRAGALRQQRIPYWHPLSMPAVCVVLIFGLLFAAPALAGTSNATFSKYFLTVYHATLRTEADAFSYDTPFSLTLRYEMSFTTEDLVERSLKEMNAQQALTPAEKQTFEPLLQKAFPTVKDGDSITASFNPQSGTTFSKNGQQTATLADVALSKRFFDIWLGEKTSEPTLRNTLLNRKNR